MTIDLHSLMFQCALMRDRAIPQGPSVCLVIPTSRGEDLIRSALLEDVSVQEAKFRPLNINPEMVDFSGFNHSYGGFYDGKFPWNVISLHHKESDEHVLVADQTGIVAMQSLARRFGGTLYHDIQATSSPTAKPQGLEVLANYTPEDWGCSSDGHTIAYRIHDVKASISYDKKNPSSISHVRALENALYALLTEELAAKGWRGRLVAALSPLDEMLHYTDFLTNAVASAIIRGIPSDEAAQDIVLPNDGDMSAASRAALPACIKAAREAVTGSAVEPPSEMNKPEPVRTRTWTVRIP